MTDIAMSIRLIQNKPIRPRQDYRTKIVDILRFSVVMILFALTVMGCSAKKPEMPPPTVWIGNVDYRYDYGDAVRVAAAGDQFVVCDSCSKSTPLARLLKPIPIAMRVSQPISSITTSSKPALTTAIITTTDSRSERSLISSPARTSVVELAKSDKDRAAVSVDSSQTGSPSESVVSVPTITAKEKCTGLSVYFDTGSSRVRDAERNKLLSLVGTLKKQQVLVKGYTCDIGSKEFNDRLAMDRAKAVAEILKGAGITPVMISGEGKCCYVSEDKALNRRVEILCVGEGS